MSYSNPRNITYGLGVQNFTTPITRFVKPPPRCNRAIIIDIAASITVLFTAVTTAGFVRVGTAADNARYAELNMGVAAANTAYNATDVPGSIRAIGIDMARDAITSVRIGTVAPTGGTPAGTADVWIAIAWS